MLKAYWKLSTRDKLVLFITASLLVTAVISLIFFLATGSIFGGIKFPDSTLLPEKTSFQEHEVIMSESLPVPVSIPGTGLGVSLAGDEMPPFENGCAFDCGDGLYTVAGRLEKSDDVESFASLYIPQMIEGTTSAGTYKKKVSGKGYLNAVYAEYYGGTVSSGLDTYYCLFYRYMGADRDIIFGTVRSSETAGTRKLVSDKAELLDKMLFTVVETGETGLSLQPLEEVKADDAGGSVAENPEGNNVGMPPVPDNSDDGGDYYLATGDGDESPAPMGGYDNFEAEEDVEDEEVSDTTKSDEILSAVKERKEKEFELAYPGHKIFRISVNVPEELSGKEVGVEMFFTEALADIPFATLRNDKTDRVESAEYLNDDIDGRVLFYINDCESGKWTLEAERAQSLGEYSVHVMEADALRAALTPNIPD